MVVAPVCRGINLRSATLRKGDWSNERRRVRSSGMAPSRDVIALLVSLVQNACVNTNERDSGHEYRSVETLREFFEGSRLLLQEFESAPGRRSLVATLPGSDPSAPSLGLLSHLDVVPAAEAGWTHPPFAGVVEDGWVWGRGVVDMLYLTSSMAMAIRSLADDGFQPRGTLRFFAVADEESGGALGAEALLKSFGDEIVPDYVVTEWGGIPIPTDTGPKFWIATGQKGGTDIRLRFRGKSAHAAMPWGSQNAIMLAAEAVSRLCAYQPVPIITPEWRRHVEQMMYQPELAAALLDPQRIDGVLDQLSPRIAARAHACTRITLAPTVISGGQKSNVIPDSCDLHVLVRRLPHQSQDDARALVRDLLGDLWDAAEVEVRMDAAPTQSPTSTPLWTALEEATQELVPGAQCVESITPGGNDGGFFRERGSVVYGYGITSPTVSFDEFAAMMHGTDERIDEESVHLATRLWRDVAKRLLGE